MEVKTRSYSKVHKKDQSHRLLHRVRREVGELRSDGTRSNRSSPSDLRVRHGVDELLAGGRNRWSSPSGVRARLGVEEVRVDGTRNSWPLGWLEQQVVVVYLPMKLKKEQLAIIV